MTTEMTTELQAPPPLNIASENDAARLLEQALRGELSLEPGQTLVFEAWPTITIKLDGPAYHGTITAATAKALVELQSAMDHAYLRLTRPSGRRLTDDEKCKTMIVAKVDKGSTLFTVDMNPALNHLIDTLSTRMSPTEIATTVLGLGLIVGATVVVKQYVKSRADRVMNDAQLASKIAMSEQETKRLQVVTEAMNRQPGLKRALEDFDDARDEVLRSAADTNTVDISGVVLTGEEARTLPRQPRETAVEMQLNGVYVICGIDWESGFERVRFELRGQDRQALKFTATLNTHSLLPEDKELLQAAEWDRKPVYMSINARRLRGDITSAVIVGFDWSRLRDEPPESDAG
ncbi:hypothetical protein [Azonexus sp.]|jgi:hypothetical protein|uniref:hypothetical protein n=1 Tax=Azonexus sp. TaxID=1872668 RepID=UPI00283AA440|nr:hypothetical protein [Azonexus sp.]